MNGLSIDQRINLAQITFALIVIAFMVVWKLGGRDHSRKKR